MSVRSSSFSFQININPLPDHIYTLCIFLVESSKIPSAEIIFFHLKINWISFVHFLTPDYMRSFLIRFKLGKDIIVEHF